MAVPRSLVVHAEVQTRGHCFALSRLGLAPPRLPFHRSKKTGAVCAFSPYSQKSGVSVSRHALSLNYREQAGFFDAENERINALEDKCNVQTSHIRDDMMPSTGDQGDVKRTGAACAWPRACDVSLGPASQAMAIDAMKNTAVAAAVSGDWDKSSDELYTANNSVDTDLPPDVEMLALFSDSPRSWRLHEEPISVKSETEELDQQPPILHWIGAWWSKMWRYQGLGL